MRIETSAHVFPSQLTRTEQHEFFDKDVSSHGIRGADRRGHRLDSRDIAERFFVVVEIDKPEAARSDSNAVVRCRVGIVGTASEVAGNVSTGLELTRQRVTTMVDPCRLGIGIGRRRGLLRLGPFPARQEVIPGIEVIERRRA